jgi:sec-independent protein translocase protein TatA
MNTLAFATPGPTDWIVILVIVLVLFGAKKIPELFKGLGQGMNEFRKAREEFDRELHGPSAEAKARQQEQIQPVQAVTYAQPTQPVPQPQQAQPVQPPVQTVPVVQVFPPAQPAEVVQKPNTPA